MTDMTLTNGAGAHVAPPVEQVAPGVVTRIREGDLKGVSTILLGLGVVGVVATLVGSFLDEESKKQAAFSYLVAYMFTLSLALGSLFFVMIQHITRAGWSIVVRRIAENMAGVLFPWMAILFVPIVLWYHELWHHWIDAVTDPNQEGYDAIIAGKSGYLNVPFFFIRAALYFVVWGLLARYFRGASLKQDQSGDPALTLSMARRSSIGLLLFALSLTFAAFDWMMSLDPHWYSTIFGVCYFGGSVMAMLAMLALVTMFLQRKGYLKDVVNAEHYHDIGKLLFAFMVFWTYVNFSQYMLIWYANIPEETLWYQHRAETHVHEGVLVPWGYVGASLIIGHFLFPFAFLMSRHMKRNRVTLAVAAVFLLVMHWLDMQYLIMPTLHHHGLHLTWLDFTAWFGVFGIAASFALRNIASSPVIPERDPRLAESLHFHNV